MAEELVKGFVTDSAKSLLGMLAARIGQEIKLVWGFKDDFRNIRRQLMIVEGMLSGADPSSDATGNRVLNEWLNKVKTVAYEADDVVDEYAYHLLKQRLEFNSKYNGSTTGRAVHPHASGKRLFRFKAKVRLYFTKTTYVMLRFRMAHKVKALKEAIAEIFAEAKELGIKPVKVAAGSYAAPSSGTALQEQQLQLRRQVVDFEGLIGRDNDKAKLISILCHPANDDTYNLNVVGIYGMSGLGKTALAKSLLETEEIKEHFQHRIMICVSHDFDWKELLKGMVEQLFKESVTLSNDEAIKEKLQEKLKEKKYLLVLDDIWETFIQIWEPVRSFLLAVGGSKGSTILVTSRSTQVLEALEIPSNNTRRSFVGPYIYQLGILLHDDGWTLFKQRLGDELLDALTLGIAEKLFQKCGGVPLAIKTLGGLLRCRKKIEEWREIEESNIWNEDATILPTVKLSFKYLPSVWLQKCFVYCAIFKEDEEIEKARLIQLWMAQGFLQPYDKMEQTGEKYFNILLDNSLFQNAQLDDKGNVIWCKMHDMVHALARVISGREICFSWGICGEDNSSSEMNDSATQIRHILVDSGRPNLSLELPHMVRTLSFNGCELDGIDKLIAKARHLRSLSLIDLHLTELPDSIGELIHLRYLDVSKNSIGSLPDGLTKLYNLQTLRVDFCESSLLPRFPKGFSNLVSLRHLSALVEMGIPEKLGMMSDLQTIPGIDVRKDWGGSISELGSLTNLKGSLCLWGLGMTGIEEAKKANLGRKDNIEELLLGWGGIEKESEFAKEDIMLQQMEALQPPPNLTTLKLSYWCCRALPKWLREMKGFGDLPLNKLTSLTFSGCDFLQLPSLENLVALENLEIDKCTFVPNLDPLCNLAHFKIRWCSINGLPSMNKLVSLKKLYISYCKKPISLPDLESLGNLEEFEIQNCTIQRFPSLKNLVALKRLWVWECENLKTMPDLEYLTSLKSMVICECLEMDNLGNIPASNYLHWLILKKCTKMTSLPFGLSSLPNLEYMELGPFSAELSSFPFPIVRDDIPTYFSLSKCLKYLELIGGGMEEIRSLPHQIQYLLSLRSLEIKNFLNLEELPEWMGNLTSLKYCRLFSLPKVKCLPSQAAMGQLTSLESLSICYCLQLKEACAQDIGPDWSKVKHIPSLSIYPENSEEYVHDI